MSIRVGGLRLIAKLSQEQGVSFGYLTYDVASAQYVADGIPVMGGATSWRTVPPMRSYTTLAPLHRALFSAVPDPRMPAKVYR